MAPLHWLVPVALSTYIYTIPSTILQPDNLDKGIDKLFCFKSY